VAVRKSQPWLIRLTHWINVPVIAIMGMSGLQILVAYPFFGPQGARYSWMPLQGLHTPDWLRAGGWLAGARHLHFAFAWLLIANAMVYVVYLVASSEYRRRLFWPPRDLVPAAKQTVAYVRALARRPRIAEPQTGLYNGLQRAGYTGALALGGVLVLSGLAMWKPVQLDWLAWVFGGYDGARVIHFASLIALGAFVVGHVVMVVLHPRTIPLMITGGKPEEHP
jgi:thiosulfate reductase cytochrome b subunit